jgi:hypothetical protein
MSEQFFYVHLKFTQEIVVEVPRGLLNQRQSDLVGKGFTEKALALDLARDVALKMASPFPAIGERAGNARQAFTTKIHRSGTRIDIAS